MSGSSAGREQSIGVIGGHPAVTVESAPRSSYLSCVRRDRDPGRTPTLAEESGLKDSLHAADLGPGVKVSHVEEVQQHLGHVLVLVDDVLQRRNNPHSWGFLLLGKSGVGMIFLSCGRDHKRRQVNAMTTP
ncbi:hypothetical protein EYF80_009905 [Liparis tanakae]|uniref:Uncharacterized protein n=1 Tax=Liparis tanakae TaxID=230148 RepID=A0A4Z2IQB3_9TELE|nr:hypothetical protein EYF80_009905 [Liparis tanakae]